MTNQPETKEVLNLSTKPEVAEAIRTCNRTVEALVANDQIPSLLIGKRRLFYLPDVIKAIRDAGTLTTTAK